MLWTTLVCVGGEIRGNAFTAANIYSSDLFTSVEAANERAYLWQTRNNRGECIQFMVQQEDVTNKLIIKNILGIY
jgi:hypothetical protein